MLEKAFDVLRLFTPTRAELGVVEVAKLLDRPVSTVSRWLAAMSDIGFLDRDRVSGRYRLGLQLVAFGEIARQSTFVQRLALPALRELTERTKETSTLGLLAENAAFDAAVVDSPHIVRPAAYPGRRYPLHPTAVGKALLAWRPDEEVLSLLPQELARYTPATITDRDEFLRELGHAREAGYATAWGEWAEDYVGIAAPLLSPPGNVLGALSLAVPLSRISERDIPSVSRLIVRIAERTSAALESVGQRDEALNDSAA